MQVTFIDLHFKITSFVSLIHAPTRQPKPARRPLERGATHIANVIRCSHVTGRGELGAGLTGRARNPVVPRQALEFWKLCLLLTGPSPALFKDYSPRGRWG